MIWLWLLLIIMVIFFGVVTLRGAPYLPSKKKYINQALRELYPLTTKDVLVDIGSGDGIVLREAAKLGARAIGYEINPVLVLVSRCLSRKNKRIEVRLVDFWLTHLPNGTTIVYVFSIQRDMKKIMKWMQNETNRLNRPIYLMSFGFELGDMEPIKNVGAYNLYMFHSLQSGEAQV
ncbi:MAG TPA: hypothetical protein VMR16_01630 [Candidatus Saccharimonadales bacterium]|nr:hypothetical protein [Candidatus Saccharimonadales bacterium]